jgi:hypothetical protein
MKPQEGHSRVWAVPRPRKCVSEEYIRHINHFCENGGLQIILDIIENEEFSEKPNQYNLCVMAILINLVSLPGSVYHKEVIQDFAERLISVTKKRLLEAPDKALREVRKEHIEAIVKAIDTLNRRLLPKEERIKKNDIMKLDVALLCLKSSFMARRIQGIKDLNLVIKNHRAFANRFSGEFLISWMFENNIFEVLFDPKGTHAQLIQRCDEIMKLLLTEEKLEIPLLEKFWALTKTDLKSEVYKIISDCSFYFLDDHLEFIFNQISQDTPVDKLDMEEFNCISELGKYAKCTKGF